MSNKNSFKSLYVYGVISLVIVILVLFAVVVAIIQGVKQEKDHSHLEAAPTIAKDQKPDVRVDTVYLPSEKIYIKCERSHCDTQIESKNPDEKDTREDSVVN